MTDPVAILIPQEIANDDSVRVVSLKITHGQLVRVGSIVAEIETSKSNIEINASAEGWAELCCKEGDDLAIGAVIAKLHPKELRQTSEPALTNHPGASAQQTVFSDAALKLIQARGLSPDVFQGRSFVRERDVIGQNEFCIAQPEPESLPVEPPAMSAALQQSFCEDWPWLRLLKADLFRINGADDAREFFVNWWTNPAFTYMTWFRIAQASRRHPIARILIYPLARWRLNSCHYRTGIRIPLSVKVGPGFQIGHWGAVWINAGCSFGANCTLGNDINIGGAGGSSKKGVPQIGDNVFIGPGARLSEPIKVGQESAIMANTVVAADLQPGSVALGVPFRVVGRHENNRFVTNRCDFQPSTQHA